MQMRSALVGDTNRMSGQPCVLPGRGRRRPPAGWTARSPLSCVKLRAEAWASVLVSMAPKWSISPMTNSW